MQVPFLVDCVSFLRSDPNAMLIFVPRHRKCYPRASSKAETIDYDEMNPFSLDCFNLKPIYKGSPMLKCAYCGSAYAPDYEGKRCITCKVSEVGVQCVGLVSSAAPARGSKST